MKRVPVNLSVAWLAKSIQKYVESVPCETCGAFITYPCENLRWVLSQELGLKESLKRTRRRYYQNRVHKARMREYERVKADRKANPKTPDGTISKHVAKRRGPFLELL